MKMDETKDRLSLYNAIKQFCTSVSNELAMEILELTMKNQITPMQINNLLNEVKGRMHTNKKDLFVFYFSGHGQNRKAVPFQVLSVVINSSTT
jgi:hypothetical protein